MSTATTNEVYEVCQRLKAAGFPQYGGDHSWEWRQYKAYSPELVPVAAEDYGDPHSGEEYHAACPNAGECMEFARARWPGGQHELHWYYGFGTWGVHINAPASRSHHHRESIDQAARLALAAALEAEHV